MSKGIHLIDPEERFILEAEGAKLTLRRIDSATMMAIERKTGGDAAKAADEALDYALVDWDGVASPLGEVEVPCTRENKLKLPTSVKSRIMAALHRPRADALIN